MKKTKETFDADFFDAKTFNKEHKKTSKIDTHRKKTSHWYKFLLPIILGLFVIHLILKWSDSNEPVQKGKKYSLEKVVCKKDNTILFNFNQRINNRTIRFENLDNVRNLIITIDYFPSRRIEVLDFDKARRKTPNGYHWNESVSLKSDTGFYLTSNKKCRITAKLKN